MRKLYSIILSVVIAASSVLNFESAVASADYLFDKDFTGDLSSASVYYNSDYANLYGVRTMRGATGWNNLELIAFDLHWSMGNSYSAADVYAQDYEAVDGMLANTTFYVRSSSGLLTQVDPNYDDWNFCTIRLNTYYDSNYTTMIHEFGHVMGLKDNNDNVNSIMCQVAHGRVATAPSTVDMIALNRKCG